ncbi:MAG: MarR family transcriptional regulator [Rhodobacterales bacterium]|nr:MarR family transcriptional regulator [Rhodobacterales bacterium]
MVSPTPTPTPPESPSESDPGFVADYLPYLLARASHAISAQFHAHVVAKGVPVAHWRVLATLSDGDGMTIGDLARVVLYKQPTLTKVVDRLERDGLVERRTIDRDRRKVRVFITAAGRALVDGLLADAKAHEVRVLSTHTADEVAVLKRVLRTLITRLDDQ